MAMLCALAAVIALASTVGWVFVKIGQPAVVGEIATGVLLGPLVFGGHMSLGASVPAALEYLQAFAVVGVVVFMFLTGMEIDTGIAAASRRVIATVSAMSYIVPFALGCALAAVLVGRHATTTTLAFVLFMGSAMSVTAFPVLARILTERRMIGTSTGQLALTCAAVVDAAAWIGLAGVTALSASAFGVQWRLLLLVPFVAILYSVVRPQLGRLPIDGRHGSAVILPVAVTGAALCGAATEWIGLHYIFGAFAFGAIFPRKSAEVVSVAVRPVSAIFLPCFFVTAGMKVDLGEFGQGLWLELIAVVCVATVGKVGGTYVGARVGGLGAGESGTLAALMNARGLTELVILTVGLELGVLDHNLYSVLVIMALVTTATTTPLLRLVDSLNFRHDSANRTTQTEQSDEGAAVGGR